MIGRTSEFLQYFNTIKDEYFTYVKIYGLGSSTAAEFYGILKDGVERSEVIEVLKKTCYLYNLRFLEMQPGDHLQLITGRIAFFTEPC